MNVDDAIEVGPAESVRRPWSDVVVVGFAVAATVGALRPSSSAGGPATLAGVAAAVALARRSRTGGALAVALTLLLGASALSAKAWQGLEPGAATPVTGWMTLRTDPMRQGAGVTAIGAVAGERYAVGAYGGTGRRLERLLAGDRVFVAGRSSPLGAEARPRWIARHVRARLSLTRVGDSAPTTPITRAANRVRLALTRGTDGWPDDDRALFLGLVIGDDRAQPPAMIDAFRTAGLSHLTAVSGQNVAFVLIAASPILRRLRPAPRVVATLTLIGWFAALTRFEPSVIRASVMAAFAATAFWRGWHAGPLRLLALTVTVCTLIDPLLVHSVGWWLSVGATTGLALGAGPVAERIPGPRWLAVPLGVTLAAQVGVLPISAAVFGRVPLFGPLANLLAVPVAGFVMVWGIPAGLLAGAVRPLAPLLGVPGLAATRWVATVARLGALLDPGWPPMVVIALHLLGFGLLASVSHRRRDGGR